MVVLSLEKRVGHHIRKLRMGRNVSQQRLADDCGLARKNLSFIENGRYPGLALNTLERICLALNVSVKEFFDSMPGI